MPDYESHAKIVDKCTQRLNALERNVTDPSTKIPMNGEQTALADVIAIYQRCLDTRAAVRELVGAIRVAMAARAEAEEARHRADRALKPWVANHFGEASREAHDFGFPPGRKGVMTAEQKARAVELGRATRAARHTMGKKERLAIRGTLPPEAPIATAPKPVAT
jgi:hypothetical protein